MAVRDVPSDLNDEMTYYVEMRLEFLRLQFKLILKNVTVMKLSGCINQIGSIFIINLKANLRIFSNLLLIK